MNVPVTRGLSRQTELVRSFKGGSLSGTYLIRHSGKLCVRKVVSLTLNREYGFFRWYTQLKRLQRFGQLFPGVFPNVLRYGREGESAYFDMEYIEGSVSGFEFLSGNPPRHEIDEFFSALCCSMDRLHAFRRPTSMSALNLYIYEEMERPLEVCGADPGFREFLSHPTLVLNGEEVPALADNLKAAYELGERFFLNPFECYTHGNLTLENTLWVPSKRQLWFVDPYEENILDTVQNEYSQLLQSSNSYYEVYNSLNAVVEGNRVTLEIESSPGIDYFNSKLWSMLRQRLTGKDEVIVRLYEVSQFTRMLPFKLSVARDKMIFFYALASRLFHELLDDVEAGRIEGVAM